MHFADRLCDAIERKSVAACVGLDPLIERIPQVVLEDAGIEDAKAERVDPAAASRAFASFGRGVIESIADIVPAIKINIAFFERYGTAGLEAYGSLVCHARDAGLVVIGDIKRADIGHTSAQYAAASLDGDDAVDAVTVNPYFGIDGVQPFLDVATDNGRGVIVLVQTSNPSAARVQGVVLADGRTLSDHVAVMVEEWAAPLKGTSGYSTVGAVVSPRDLPSTRRIRALMPSCLFLVPGFGAQGRTGDEVRECFKPDGSGALVTASRSVIFAHLQREGVDYRTAVRDACVDMVRTIREAVPHAS